MFHAVQSTPMLAGRRSRHHPENRCLPFCKGAARGALLPAGAGSLVREIRSRYRLCAVVAELVDAQR